MEQLARFVFRQRRLVLVLWLALTIFGAFSAQKVSSRWLESFTIPGYSAYEANQRTLEAIGSGAQAPLVAVIVAPGRDVTKIAGARAAFSKAAAQNPGSRYSDYFTTGSNAYVFGSSLNYNSNYVVIVQAALPKAGEVMEPANDEPKPESDEEFMPTFEDTLTLAQAANAALPSWPSIAPVSRHGLNECSK
jgi:hypothetical protein